GGWKSAQLAQTLNPREFRLCESCSHAMTLILGRISSPTISQNCLVFQGFQLRPGGAECEYVGRAFQPDERDVVRSGVHFSPLDLRRRIHRIVSGLSLWGSTATSAAMVPKTVLPRSDRDQTCLCDHWSTCDARIWIKWIGLYGTTWSNK